MTESPIFAYIMIALTGLVIGVAKGGLGSALGSLATPMLTLIMPANMALGVSLPMLLVGDLFALWVHWKRWDQQVVLKLLPGTVLGVLVGSALLGKLTARSIEITIGVLTLIFCVYKLFLERRLRRDLSKSETRPWYAPFFGTGSGLASTVGNAGGPVYTMYVLMLHQTPEAFGATAALYFAILNAIKIPGYLSANVLHPENILQYAWVIPIIFVGAWLGRWISRHVDIRTFEIIILVLLLIIAVFLLVK
jgi:uncharacterized protein